MGLFFGYLRELRGNDIHQFVFAKASNGCYIRVMATSGFSDAPTPSLAAAGKLQTFADESDRARLTPAALEAVRNLAAAWKLTGDDAAALLGVSPSTWDRIRGGSWKQALSQDQLTRVSALVGIFKGLHLLFADGMANCWPRCPTPDLSSPSMIPSTRWSMAAFP